VPDQSRGCKKVISARFNTLTIKKKQDDRWDAYISDLKPSWTIPGVDREAVKERRCKRARSIEQGLVWFFKGNEHIFL
jgi:hypothetical protein